MRRIRKRRKTILSKKLEVKSGWIVDDDDPSSENAVIFLVAVVAAPKLSRQSVLGHLN